MVRSLVDDGSSKGGLIVSGNRGFTLRRLPSWSRQARSAIPHALSLARVALLAATDRVATSVHPDREVRASATRTLGRMVEVVPAWRFSARRRTELFEALSRCLADRQPVVLAKILPSFGKMGAAGDLSAPQVEPARQAAHAMRGHGELYEWDLPYIVRRDTQEALRLLG